ncbi:MAG: helix-turn-helix transcriptional regulator [Lachnospiraceae bacterium]|nr:helix-turn-helix transcriptional regulator [Lachnospiraceae bacterium]
MNAQKIGAILRNLRGTKTLGEVSKAVKISVSALTMYENGKRVPRDEIKIRLARYYQRKVEDIFFAQ